jgi:hypothetical protein
MVARGILVRHQLRAILMALIFLAVSASNVGAQTESTVAGWVKSYLPKGETVKTSTCADLPPAVIAAIRAHPKQGKAIVRYVFSQFLPTDNCKALAVIDAMNASLPKDEIAGLIAVGIGSLSAAIDPATGQSALLALSALITERAIADNPALASALLAAIGAAAPGQAAPGQSLLGAGTGAGTNPSNFSGPGSATNPANSANTSGQVTSPF